MVPLPEPTNAESIKVGLLNLFQFRIERSRIVRPSPDIVLEFQLVDFWVIIPASCRLPLPFHAREREFFIDNLLVRLHFIFVMIRWTGLAPWEFEFAFPGSLISTFLVLPRNLLGLSGQQERSPCLAILKVHESSFT